MSDPENTGINYTTTVIPTPGSPYGNRNTKVYLAVGAAFVIGVLVGAVAFGNSKSTTTVAPAAVAPASIPATAQTLPQTQATLPTRATLPTLTPPSVATRNTLPVPTTAASGQVPVDARITACAMPANDQEGPQANYTIVNQDVFAHNFKVAFQFNSADGSRLLDSASVTIPNLGANQTYSNFVFSQNNALRTQTVTCRIAAVTAFDN